MKRVMKLSALLLLLFAGGGFGLWQYMQAGDQGQAAEAAAAAVVTAANAAAQWTKDRSTHEVSVVNMMGTGRGGGIDGPFVVEVRLSVKGGANLSALCAALPRVHDAINVVLADRVNDVLRARAPLAADSFAAYAETLRARLNRAIAPDAVSEAQVIVHSARNMQERGCNDRKPAKKTEAARN